MKKGIVLSLSIIVGIVFMLFQVARAASQTDCPACDSFGIQRPQEKKPAPAFTLKGMDGNPVSLTDVKGKPALVVFWATW